MPDAPHEWLDKAAAAALAQDLNVPGLTDRWATSLQDWQRYLGGAASKERAGTINTAVLVRWLIENKVAILAAAFEVPADPDLIRPLPGDLDAIISRGKRAEPSEEELDRREADALGLEEVLVNEGIPPARARQIAAQAFGTDPVPAAALEGPPPVIPPETLELDGLTFDRTTEPPVDIVWRELTDLAARFAGENGRRIPNAGDWRQARLALAVAYRARHETTAKAAPRGPIGPMDLPPLPR